MEKPMNSDESLMIIQRMINTAKEDLEDSSFYYLIWGWLVFIACVVHFILIRVEPQMQGIGWMILMPAGGIITMIYGYRQGKKQRVQTYIDSLFKFVLISFLVSLGIVLVFMNTLRGIL